MKFHLYADDIQLYLSFDGRIPVSKQDALTRMEACIADIKAWMLLNFLKLNDSKTEFLEFHPSHSSTHTESSFSIGTDVHTAKNLGVVLDDRLSLSMNILLPCVRL